MKSLSLFIQATILVLVLDEAALSVPLTGDLTLFYWKFDGIINPVDITLNGQSQNTGPITYSLNLTNPANQIHTFNFDNRTEQYQVDLLVTAPLLKSLGQPDQRITVSFSGPITNIVPADLTPGVFTDVLIQGGPLQGGGTFGPGQLFAGWSYENIQINNKNTTNNVNGNGNVIETKQKQQTETNVDGQVTGRLRPPGGGIPIPLTGTGTGLLNPVPFPEPSSVILLASGLAGLAGYRWRQTKKQQD